MTIAIICIFIVGYIMVTDKLISDRKDKLYYAGMIIGSAAGVVVMGIQNISFGWYMKKFTWIVLLGYLAGISAFALLA